LWLGTTSKADNWSALITAIGTAREAIAVRVG
jgi:hypothetical protein